MKRWAISGAPSNAQIDAIAALLRSGGVVLMPTDTIYGVHALPSQSSKVADIKGRDEAKRFVTIAASIDQVPAEVPDALRSIWPAPLTAILRSGGATIAVRVPDLGWLRELLEKTGPLISTSANRSGDPPVIEPSALPRDVLERMDGVVDNGRMEAKPSAIVDFTETEPRFIRDGEPPFTQMLRKTLLKKL
ncbi:MAG TPA: L-threonylcarbamoyladenylate synthase [Thermoanaerobaculia bacterium]|nr:L-threonylcarbamoyladenylate synthase [Thermoanaerobaculia bacterium]